MCWSKDNIPPFFKHCTDERKKAEISKEESFLTSLSLSYIVFTLASIRGKIY